MPLRPRTTIAWLLIALAPASVSARMYQWVSPASATPQLSGEPPPWYRSDYGGPRVRVFENGNLVDDTSIELPAVQREELRAAAFREAEERQRAEAVERLERAARREEKRKADQERALQAQRDREAEARRIAVRSPVSGEAAAEEGTAPSALPDTTRIDDATVERLKAIIAEFDRSGGTR